MKREIWGQSVPSSARVSDSNLRGGRKTIRGVVSWGYGWRCSQLAHCTCFNSYAARLVHFVLWEQKAHDTFGSQMQFTVSSQSQENHFHIQHKHTQDTSFQQEAKHCSVGIIARFTLWSTDATCRVVFKGNIALTIPIHLGNVHTHIYIYIYSKIKWNHESIVYIKSWKSTDEYVYEIRSNRVNKMEINTKSLHQGFHGLKKAVSPDLKNKQNAKDEKHHIQTK